MSGTRRLLTRVRSRLALRRLVEDLQVSGAAAGVLAASVLGARALRLHDLEWTWAAWAAAVVLLAWPLARMVLRRPTDAEVAALADHELGLEERVSTALWCERSPADERSPLAHLVEQDASSVAGTVPAGALRHAFRPKLRRRPAAVAAVAVLCAAGLAFVVPEATARETPAQRLARLEDEERIARVARQLQEAAKRVEEVARQEELAILAETASAVHHEAEKMVASPPNRSEALTRLNELRDLAEANARKAAGMESPPEAKDAREMNKALSKMLQDLAQAGLETLQEDLDELEERLSSASEDGKDNPTAEDVRQLANRIDALRRALEQAAGTEGARRLEERLRSVGNEDLLEKISQRMREIASRMEQNPGYQGLDGGEGESMNLNQLSREELEQLLKDLEEMAAMDDLSRMLQQGGQAMNGSRRLRLRAGGT